MYHFKKILHGFDLEHASTEAFDYAIHMAAKDNAVLSILYIIPSYELPLISSYFPSDSLHEEIEKSYERIEKICQEKIPEEVQWEVIVKEGSSPYSEIIDFASEKNMELIVLGEHDRHGLDDILLGSNTEKVVRHAPCSVLIIKDKNSDK